MKTVQEQLDDARAIIRALASIDTEERSLILAKGPALDWGGPGQPCPFEVVRAAYEPDTATPRIGRIVQVAAALAVDADLLYALSEDGKLYAFHDRKGGWVRMTDEVVT